MKKIKSAIVAPLATVAIALGMSACASQVSMPTLGDYQSGLVGADTPLKRCLLNADFGDMNADFMRPEDLQAGYNANKGAERLVYVNNELSIGFAGYSARSFSADMFLRGGDPLRARMYRAFENAQMTSMDQDDIEVLADLGGIDVVENAMLALDAGDVDCATILFEAVQEIDEAGEADSRFSRFFSDDVLLGYEQVMLYNYRALGYLLAGDKNAIPATIAAASRMESNREKYSAELANLRQQRANEQSSADSSNPLLGFFLGGNFVQMLDSLDDFKYSTQLSGRVASPYLNPLSNYIRAVVAEAEAIQDPERKSTEWDTARIAWQQASELLPTNGFLKASLDKVQDYRRNGLPENTKLVHVVTASGFAPRKKLVKFVRATGRCTPFAFNIDAMTPIRTNDYGVFADIGDGNMQPLELMADVEAMAARFHQDRLSDRIATRAIISVTNYIAASIAEDQAGGLLGCALGAIGGFAGDAALQSSTKSWASLPAQMRAIRLEVPVDTQSIRLGLQGANGQVVSWEEFDLLADEATVIYARVVDGGIWGSAQNSPFGSGEIKRPQAPTPSVDVAAEMNWSLGR